MYLCDCVDIHLLNSKKKNNQELSLNQRNFFFNQRNVFLGACNSNIGQPIYRKESYGMVDRCRNFDPIDCTSVIYEIWM